MALITDITRISDVTIPVNHMKRHITDFYSLSYQQSQGAAKRRHTDADVKNLLANVETESIESDADADEHDLPVSFEAIIYAYYNASAVAVYVGQTVQELEKRDRDHWVGKGTVFDRAYRMSENGERTFQLRTIERMFFHAADFCSNRARMTEACQAWLDQQEKHHIASLNTYRKLGDGLNYTRGGQGRGSNTWLRLMLQASIKRSTQRFEDKYLPMIKSIVEEHQRDVNVPQRGYDGVEGSKQMGTLLHSIRSGRTTPRADFVDYINAAGFDMNRRDAEHKRKWDRYMVMIKSVVEQHRRDVNVPQAGYDGVEGSKEMGILQQNIRSGHTTPRVDFLAYINSVGFDMNLRDAKWDRYLVTIKSIVEEHRRNVNVPGAGYDGVKDSKQMGVLLDCIRRGDTTPRADFLDYINAAGFDMNRRDAEHERTWDRYFVTMKSIVEEHQRDVNVPPAGYNGVEGSKQMGTLITSIRSGCTTPRADFLDYINAVGFDMNRRDAEHERKWDTYLVVIKSIVEDHRRNVNVPVEGFAGVEGSKQMGKLFNRIRTGNTTPRRDFIDYINGAGFDMNRLDAEHARRWDRNLVTMKSIVEQHQQDVNVPQAGYDGVEGSKQMGRLITNIRYGHTTPRADFLDYINALGFDMNRQEAEHERKWDRYLVTIKSIVEEHQRDVNVPMGGYDGAEGSKQMGALLNSIRSGATTPRADFLEYINAAGFLHSAQNLFVHLQKRYQQDPAAMPANGNSLDGQWVSEFQRVHAIIRGGKGNMRFGKSPMSDAEVRARYTRDRAKATLIRPKLIKQK